MISRFVKNVQVNDRIVLLVGPQSEGNGKQQIALVQKIEPDPDLHRHRKLFFRFAYPLGDRTTYSIFLHNEDTVQLDPEIINHGKD